MLHELKNNFLINKVCEKSHLLIIIIFFIIGIQNIGFRSFLWDETQNSVIGIFLKMLFKNNNKISIDVIKEFGLNVQSHYPFFGNMMHHPPLQRFFVVLSFFFLRINESSARLPSLIIGSIGLYYVYMLGKEFGGKKVGLLSLIFLMLSPMYFEYSRLCMIEIFLTVFSLICVYYFLKLVKIKNRRYVFIFGIFFGLNLIIKFPAILLMPPLIIYLMIFHKDKFRVFIISLIIAFLIFIPWILILFILPTYFNVPYFILEKYDYFDIKPIELNWIFFSHIKQFSYLIGLIFIISVIYACYKKEKKEILLVLWIFSFYLFFCLFVIPSKGSLHRFIMPAMPAGVILSVLFLEKFIKNKFFYFILIVISLLLLGNYISKVEIKYPMEETTLWIINDSPENCTVLSTKDLQFYFMKNDKNLSLNFRTASTLEELKNYIENKKNSYDRFDLAPSRICYVITKNIPLETFSGIIIDNRSIYNVDISSCQDCFVYLSNNEKFKLVKTFGDKEKLFVYKNSTIEKSN